MSDTEFSPTSGLTVAQSIADTAAHLMLYLYARTQPESLSAYVEQYGARFGGHGGLPSLVALYAARIEAALASRQLVWGLDVEMEELMPELISLLFARQGQLPSKEAILPLLPS